MSSDGRRPVIRAFIANTTPKNRSHEMTPSVRILATSISTKEANTQKFKKSYSTAMKFVPRQQFYINQNAERKTNIKRTSILS